MDGGVEVLGEALFRQRLERVAARAETLSPALERMAEQFQAHMRAVFESEGGAAGERWPSLAPAYAKWKAKHYPGAGLLVREGKLRNAMTGGEGAIRRVSARRLELGGRRPSRGGELARLHQSGTRRMRARRMLGLPAELRRQWLRVMEEHLSGE